MKIKLALATAVIVSAATTLSHAGCMRCGPIQNVTDATVPTVSGHALSNDDVKKAIMRAGTTLGWKMSADAPGKITGRLEVRKHTAVVEIPYSTKSYSIVYKSSTNLDGVMTQLTDVVNRLNGGTGTSPAGADNGNTPPPAYNNAGGGGRAYLFPRTQE